MRNISKIHTTLNINYELINKNAKTAQTACTLLNSQALLICGCTSTLRLNRKCVVKINKMQYFPLFVSACECNGNVKSIKWSRKRMQRKPSSEKRNKVTESKILIGMCHYNKTVAPFLFILYGGTRFAAIYFISLCVATLIIAVLFSIFLAFKQAELHESFFLATISKCAIHIHLHLNGYKLEAQWLW